jgi:hypothetical protein
VQSRGGRNVAARVWSGRGLQTALVFLLPYGASLSARDQDSLHDRIDKAVEAAFVGAPSPLADDAAFLRRIFLDLTGRIPGSREARAFLDDAAADKRARMIDRLLASPEHVRHLATTFDVWLMERRADKHVKTDEWRAFLVEFFKASRPYNELAREVLGSDGADPARRAASRFVLDRDVAPDALTRDVGRMFFGMDLQCAQCHDHPRIEDYLQRDYYGLYAFLSRASLFQPDPKKPAVVMEKPDGDVAFKSVFTKAEGNTRPRMPDGLEIDEPLFTKGDEYQVKPDPKDKSLRPVPKFSRKAQLARLMGEGASRAFNRNIANRLWAHMMGRGIVEPVDLHHSDNPPSNPELLELLGAEFAAMKYDLRSFLRELALTRTYQRSIEMPPSAADPSAGAAEKIAALVADAGRLREAAAKAEEAVKKAAGDLESGRKGASTVVAELARADALTAEAKKAVDASVQARDTALKELSARQDLRRSVAEAGQKVAEAAARLSGDAELAAAAATFQRRAGRLDADVAASTKEAEEKSAAAAAKAETLTTAEKAAGSVRARLAEANAGIKSLAGAFMDADAGLKRAKVAAATAKRREADTRLLAEYGSLSAAAAESREALKRIRLELGAARDVVDREATFEERKKAHGLALGAAEVARRDLASHEEVALAVSEAAAKAEEVALKASKDAELVTAAGKVKARRDAVTAECAGFRKTAAEKEEALQKAAAEFAAAGRARAGLAGAREKIPALEAQLKPAGEKAAADNAKRDEAFGKLTAAWTNRFAVAVLDPLTPEQICWSMMQATGVVDQQRAAAEAEFAKKAPPLPAAERAGFVENYIQGKLGGNEGAFVKVFGGGPGQPQDEFYATVDQALFLENGGLVRGWLAPGGGNLADRLLKIQDTKELARELYLCMFSRPPSERETDEILRHLAARPLARLAAIQEIVWAMLTSVEFRFKH